MSKRTLFAALAVGLCFASVYLLVALVRFRHVPAASQKQFILSVAHHQDQWHKQYLGKQFALARCCEKRVVKESVLRALRRIQTLEMLYDSAYVLLEKISLAAGDAALAQQAYLQYRALGKQIIAVVTEIEFAGASPTYADLFNPLFFTDDELIPPSFFGDTETVVELKAAVLSDHLNRVISHAVQRSFEDAQGCGLGCASAQD